jgi:hypothetical protein
MELEDYPHAVKYFDLALSQKLDLYAVLYRLGKAFNRIYTDKDVVRQKLFSYFAKPEYTPNALLGADILAEEGLLLQACDGLKNLTDSEDYQTELTYIKGKILFYRQQPEEALPMLDLVCRAPEQEKRILRGIRPLSAIMLFASGLMQNNLERLARALEHMKSHCRTSEYDAAILMHEIFMGNTPEDTHYDDEGREQCTAILNILDIILKYHQFDLFERLLYSLNYVESKDILLRLAQLYNKNGLLSLAADHVIRSIKEMDSIDASGAEILIKYYRQL